MSRRTQGKGVKRKTVGGEGDEKTLGRLFGSGHSEMGVGVCETSLT